MTEIRLEDRPQEWLVARVKQIEEAFLQYIGVPSMKGKRLKFEIKAVTNGFILEYGTIFDTEAMRGEMVFQEKEKLISYLKEKVNKIPECPPPPSESEKL